MRSWVNVEKVFFQQSSLSVIQRSQSHPYLWLRVRLDEAGYVAGCMGVSVYAIAWNDCSGVKGDRTYLGNELVSFRVRKECGEKEDED